MGERVPDGRVIEGHPTDVKAAAVIPGTRDVLENIYNDFLDAKQKEEIPLDRSFDSWIRASVDMLKRHRKQELREQWEIGSIGRAEYEALEEYREKLTRTLESCNPSGWGFDQFGIQYIRTEDRHLFRERVGKSQLADIMGQAKEEGRPVKIKTGSDAGIG